VDTKHAAAALPEESGFGMIEIVISMFLLALLAIAFLPLLVQGVRQSAVNSSLAAATQLVNNEMELARSRTTCSSLTATTFSVVDSRGLTLQLSRTVGGTCPAATVPPAAPTYPMTVPVTVTVTRTDTGAVLSSATTLIFVAAN
jgi:type II secretory pathway pseudopilin PulG